MPRTFSVSSSRWSWRSERKAGYGVRGLDGFQQLLRRAEVAGRGGAQRVQEAGAARSTAPPSRRKAGAGRRELEEAESGGGRRATRLFVVRFDPEGEPETLTFLA